MGYDSGEKGNKSLTILSNKFLMKVKITKRNTPICPLISAKQNGERIVDKNPREIR